MRRIEYLIYLFLFLLPWQTRLILRHGVLNNGNWEYGIVGVYGTELILWFLMLVYVWRRIFVKKTLAQAERAGCPEPQRGTSEAERERKFPAGKFDSVISRALPPLIQYIDIFADFF